MAIPKNCKAHYVEDEIVLNVVIAVYHSFGNHQESSINNMLERVQEQLKEELDKYLKIQVAYTFEAPDLQGREFTTLEENSTIRYKHPFDSKDSAHNLRHIWFMALAMLERKLEKDRLRNGQETIENRVYLLTDERFRREHVNQMFWKQDSRSRLHSRFAKLVFEPVLVKSDVNAGGDRLEEYIASCGRIEIMDEREKKTKE